MSGSDQDSVKRTQLMHELAKVRNDLKMKMNEIDLLKEQKISLAATVKTLNDSFRTLTSDRDRAIGQKFVQTNEINDEKKISAQEEYNNDVERKLLEEQRKFNNSKILLEELNERIEMVDRNLTCIGKKTDAVRREIEKVKKSRPLPVAPKSVSIAKMFSSPPPVISNAGQNKATSSRSGILNFFRRN